MRSALASMRESSPAWYAAAGRAIVWARFLILVAWIAGAAAAVALLPSIFGAEESSLGNLLPASSRAVVAEHRGVQEFGLPFVSGTLVVAHADRPLGAARTEAAAAYIAAVDSGRAHLPLRAVPLAQLPETLSSAGRRSTLLTYVYARPGSGEGRQKAATGAFASGLAAATHLDQVAATGPVPGGWAQQHVGNQRLLWLELATVAVVVVILAGYFRAAFVPLLGIGTVGLAYLVAAHALGWAGSRLGVTVPSEVDPVIVALLFGTLTDYVVFFVSAWRRRLAAGMESRQAVAEATAELLPVVLTAALMITGSILTLLLSGVHFLVAFAPGMAVAVATGAAVAVTFVPAVLACVGPGLLWPHGPGPERQERRAGGARARVVGFAARHPILVAVPTSLALAALGLGILRMSLGDPLVRGLPTSAAPRRGYDLVAESFGPGMVGPTTIMVEGRGIAESRTRLDELQAWLEARPGVAAVVGPADDPLARAHGAVLAPGGDAARFAVVLDTDPSGAPAIETLTRVEGELPGELQSLGLGKAEVWVSGVTAVALELSERTSTALFRIVPIALLIPLLLLWALLRNKTAALYLIAATVLTILAALGLTTFYFQSILGHAELAFFVPVAAGILILALASDYNVFFVSRIWREAERQDLGDAIVTAGARAGRTVTVAGMTLVLSFAAVALIPILAFRELAFALCAGLLLDTLVVRTLLVPALIAIFGPSVGAGRRRDRRDRGS